MPGSDPPWDARVTAVRAQIDTIDATECRAALHLMAGAHPLSVAEALLRLRHARIAAAAANLRERPAAEIQELADLAWRLTIAPLSSTASELLEELRIKVYKPAKRKRWLRSPVISPYTGGRAELAEVISAAKARIRGDERAKFDEHDLAAAARYEDS